MHSRLSTPLQLQRATLPTAIALLVLLQFGTANLLAQEGESEGGIPGEALRRRQQDVAAVQIRSAEPSMQRQALETLSELAPTGDADFRARTEEILSTMLLPDRIVGGDPTSGSYPQIRLEAVRLAGRLDSRGSARMLFELLGRESEPAILAQAALELSRMRYVEPRRLAERLGELLRRENADRRDSRLATALIRAAQTLYDEWGVEDPILVREILSARELNYSREVRQGAEEFVEAVLEG